MAIRSLFSGMVVIMTLMGCAPLFSNDFGKSIGEGAGLLVAQDMLVAFKVASYHDHNGKCPTVMSEVFPNNNAGNGLSIPNTSIDFSPSEDHGCIVEIKGDSANLKKILGISNKMNVYKIDGQGRKYKCSYIPGALNTWTGTNGFEMDLDRNNGTKSDVAAQKGAGVATDEGARSK